jgi:hypothetical protein
MTVFVTPIDASLRYLPAAVACSFSENGWQVRCSGFTVFTMQAND